MKPGKPSIGAPKSAPGGFWSLVYDEPLRTSERPAVPVREQLHQTYRQSRWYGARGEKDEAEELTRDRVELGVPAAVVRARPLDQSSAKEHLNPVARRRIAYRETTTTRPKIDQRRWPRSGLRRDLAMTIADALAWRLDHANLARRSRPRREPRVAARPGPRNPPSNDAAGFAQPDPDVGQARASGPQLGDDVETQNGILFLFGPRPRSAYRATAPAIPVQPRMISRRRRLTTRSCPAFRDLCSGRSEGATASTVSAMVIERRRSRSPRQTGKRCG